MRRFLITIVSLLLYACKHSDISAVNDSIIASGQMPQLAQDKKGTIHLSFGKGDSLLYSFSADKGKNFNTPQLIRVFPGLASSHMRGPQITVTSDGLLVTVCTKKGDLYSLAYNNGRWAVPVRLTDRDSVAKENFMAVAADGSNVFAVWLDLRSKHNQVFGSRSTNAGRSWSVNKLIYASPDSTVCQCCKPSVVVHGNNVYVMFRNWLNGNRDLYLVRSSDGGQSFGEAEKLGYGTWSLKGCPMDGGGLVINNKGEPETVWNRKGIIYSCEPGKKEKQIGEGRSCTTDMVNGKQVYAWVEKTRVVVLLPGGRKESFSEGQTPILKTIDDHHILCAWENNKQIHRTILQL